MRLRSSAGVPESDRLIYLKGEGEWARRQITH
jgi:hypothetical protein